MPAKMSGVRNLSVIKVSANPIAPSIFIHVLLEESVNVVPTETTCWLKPDSPPSSLATKDNCERRIEVPLDF